jgi:hypothetical protein
MASTAYKNTLEVGANGSAVTVANSAGGGVNGDAFTNVVIAAGSPAGTITWLDPLPWGGKGVKITPGSTASYPDWRDEASTETRRIARRPVWLGAEVTGTVNLLSVYAGASAMGALTLVGPGANVRRLAIQNSGFVHQAASMSVAVGTSTLLALALNHLYWVEFAVRSTGADGGAGLEYRLLDTDGVTELATYSLAIATNANPPTRVRFGPNTSAAIAADYLDDLRWEAKSAGWLGPLAATPPTLVVTRTRGDIIETTGSSVPVGSIDYSIVQTAGPATPPVEVVAWFITPHATETLTYEVTADGSLGGSDDEIIVVPPASSGGGPASRVVRLRKTAGGWV